MTSEERASRSGDSPSTPAAQAKAGALTLGLILAPDVPEKIATEIASELPDLLGSRVDGSVSWDVPLLVDPLTGTNREAPEILDVCRQRRLSEGWDLAFVAAWMFIPGGYFQSTLKRPVGFGEYLTLAWLGTSLATVARALGASLEDEERVRAASYSYRQRHRHDEEEDVDSENGS